MKWYWPTEKPRGGTKPGTGKGCFGPTGLRDNPFTRTAWRKNKQRGETYREYQHRMEAE